MIFCSYFFIWFSFTAFPFIIVGKHWTNKVFVFSLRNGWRPLSVICICRAVGEFCCGRYLGSSADRWAWGNWSRTDGVTAAALIHFLLVSVSRGAPKGRARGRPPPPPLGPEKHYIFRVSSVKLRDLHLWSLFFMLFAMWEDWGSLQHGK